MKTSKKILAVLFYVFFLQVSQAAFASVRLPQLIRDSMVLQRDTKIKIWGWADVNEKVTISFNNKNYKAIANFEGKWTLVLDDMKAGGPYTMSITGKNKIVLKDILIGDVWICSGQSNMVHQMELHNIRYANEIASADYPEIRHFWIPSLNNLQKPQDDLPPGYWKCANSKNVLQFSAVAFFFAQTIYEKYHVPIGLINASVGGTPIEAWISEEGFKEFSAIQEIVQKNKDTDYINSKNKKAYGEKITKKQDDAGLISKWFDTSYIPKGWHNINIPGYWEDQGIKDLDGVVWFRKEINVPQSIINIPAKLFLGRIVDADNVYINGKLTGTTAYQYPQRRYTIAAGTMHVGKNIITVRVQNNLGKGGFVPDKPYYIFAGKDTIDLKGYWQYKVGEVYSSQSGAAGTITLQNQPTALYNAMIAPLINYSCKGFLWYQGETNTTRATEYEKLQIALINDWRNKWNEPSASFLFVQLPGFMDMNYLPSESQWAQLRQAQFKTLSVHNTGMAVAIDLGEWNDIHPDRKKEIGVRLALQAEKVTYGERDIVYSGPLYQSVQLDGNKIIVSFSNIGSGMISNDGDNLYYFSIAGVDKKFVWAKAIIRDDKVIVWNESIEHPVFVRYAWADNPEGANLYNKEGMPASPFEAEVNY